MLKFKVKLIDGSTTEAYLSNEDIDCIFDCMFGYSVSLPFETFKDVKDNIYKYDEVVELSYEVN